MCGKRFSQRQDNFARGIALYRPHLGTTDLLVAAAIAGTGIIHSFEDWLRPHFESGALKPILERWWRHISGPFLYYPSRCHMPAALRAFVDFIRVGRG